jgi:hypothetical protein
MLPIILRGSLGDGTDRFGCQGDLIAWRGMGLVLCLTMLAAGLAGFWIKFAL